LAIGATVWQTKFRLAFAIHLLNYIRASADTATNTQAAQSPARYRPYYMNTPKFFVAFLFLLFITGCDKKILLTDKALKWIPYKGNETLIFNSNTRDTDTIFLLGANRQLVPSDPLDVFPTNLDHFSISARHSDPCPPSGNQRYLEGSFLELTVGEDKQPYIGIDLTAKDSWFYGGRFLFLKNLDTIKPISLKTSTKVYKDIIILTPESTEYFDRSNYVTKVYWSKSEGLIRFDKKDSVYWELVNKYGL